MRWIPRAVALGLLAGCGPAPQPATSLPVQESLKIDFESVAPHWTFAAGTWEPRGPAGARVLAQTAFTDPWAVAILEGKTYADFEASVRFRPVSGEIDRTGGLIFRARDARNYYLVRANALEDNFRLYTIVDGRRKQIASAKVTPPASGEWHEIQVAATGTRIRASLNGTPLLDHEDATFSGGFLGLWTKADAVTEFRDFEVRESSE